jgi:predicted type IV restriction endonuclease
MPQSIVNEPFYWTWNFLLTAFLTVVVLPTVAWMITNSFKRQFAERDKKDEKILTLLAEKEDEKTRHLAELDTIKQADISAWRREFAFRQCEIKDKVQEIADNIAKIEREKVDWLHCNGRRLEEDRAMREIEMRIRVGGL